MRQLRTSDTPHPATKFLYVSETVLADAAGVCAALFARCEPLSNSRSVLEVALLASPAATLVIRFLDGMLKSTSAPQVTRTPRGVRGSNALRFRAAARLWRNE